MICADKKNMISIVNIFLVMEHRLIKTKKVIKLVNSNFITFYFYIKFDTLNIFLKNLLFLRFLTILY